MPVSINKFLIAIILLVFNACCFGQSPQGNPDITALPVLQWKFSTSAALYASPVGDADHIYFGGLDSIFYAVNRISGKEVWRFKTNGAIRSTALLNDEHIYFISADGKLYCLDTKGKMIWTFAGIEKKYDFADYHQSSPVLSKGMLYAGMGDGYLYAVSATTGNLKWKFKTGGPVHTAPVVDEKRVYFGSFDGNVYAANINTGKQWWKFKTVGHVYFPTGEVQGNPTLMNNTVVVGARDYNVYAIDKEKGFAHWNKVFTRGWVLSNTCKDSTLYMAGADERMLAAIDSKTLAERWKRTMELLVFGKPAFSNNMLYIGTTMGKLHGIDMKTGEDKWIFKTDSYTKNHLKYFKEDDTYRDDIYSIITTNEQFLDAQVELGGIFSTPLIQQEYIFFTSTDGALYCLKAGK
ncbi:MAG: PQQ-binding-like beta-propeller repeat protein [Chitinophagaceae bacterium]|nr:PQQ-binding-like beta-propeller repeat protein [Chitinophagaceae bacterium]